MRTLFLQKLDIVTSNSAPGLTDSEISLFLTDAEFNYVKKNLPPEGTVDALTINKRNLSTLYVNDELTVSPDQTGAFTNGQYWSIPSNMFYILTLFATMNSPTTCLNGTEVMFKPINYDEYNTNIKNPFKQPGKGLGWYLEGEPYLTTQRIQTIISGDFSGIDTLSISYIKRPNGITVDSVSSQNQVNSILPDITHIQIVDDAVELAKLQLNLLQEYQAQSVYNEENK